MSCFAISVGRWAGVAASLSQLRRRLENRRSLRSLRRPPKECVEEPRRLGLVAGHEVSVAVERDRYAGVAHVDAERLGVHAGGDHERGEGVAALVETDRREAGLLPDA